LKKQSNFEKPYHGISEYKTVLKMTYEYFPDLRIILNKVVPNTVDNSATVVWEFEEEKEITAIYNIVALAETHQNDPEEFCRLLIEEVSIILATYPGRRTSCFSYTF
jgi:hypothetical protein